MYNRVMLSRSFYTTSFSTIFFLLSAVFLLVSCDKPATEHYGFITTLGNDTISIESVNRQGNSLTINAVDRFPRVRVRHSVIELNDNGSISHLVMDIHTPSEPAAQQECKVIADVSDNKVHVTKTDGAGTLTRDFNSDGSVVVAHVPQMYSLYELYFAAALKQAALTKSALGSTVNMRQFYIDREFDRFPLGRVHVTPLGNGKMEITHDWLAGTGEAMMDSGYHMLSYSGARTTYKVKVSRLVMPPDVKSIALQYEALESKSGIVKQLSVRDTVKAQIGNAAFTVDYGRPLLRGRKLLGDVIPYDRVWRTGANAATQFTTSAPIKLAGLPIAAGTYTLFTIPHTNGVDLIVNKQAGQWGTEYNSSRNLGIVRVNSELVSVPVEEFTISIIPAGELYGTLVMEWGTFRWTARVDVE